MKLNRQLLVGALLTGIAMIAITAINDSYNQEASTMGVVPVLSPLEVTNPDIAKSYGIRGYLDVSTAADMQPALLEGNSCGVTLLLHFVSFQDDLKEIEVTLDPTSGLGLSIARVYNGVEFSLNQMASYNVSKVITIKDGEVVPVKLTVDSKADLPAGFSIPLGAVGIMATVPIIDNTQAAFVEIDE